jgi:2-polyprenyl-6-methoxyphenol hydroxylase-like FAD-dependent oxidoreductase
MMSDETFVLIVGGGPVGLTLALDLGWRGAPAILVNENVETVQHPKCNVINGRTIEHFNRLGLANEIRRSSAGGVVPAKLSFRTRFCGYELGSVDIPPTGEVSGWPGQGGAWCGISQVALEEILKRHAEQKTSVNLRFGWRVVDVRISEVGAEALIECVTTGKQQKIRARYVVGCDGSESLVREAIGAKLVGKDGAFERRVLSSTKISYFIQSEDLVEKSRIERAAVTWIINKDTCGYIINIDEKDRYVIHYQVPPGASWKNVQTNAVLDRLFGCDVDYQVLSSAPWTGVVAKVADRYSYGAGFIAGDAAHIFAHLGGLCMNTGIGDAINLGWKLGAVHQGWGGQGLLDTYSTERQEIGIRNSIFGVYWADRKERWVPPDDLEVDSPLAAVHRRQFGRFLETNHKDEYQTIGVQLGELYASSIIIDPPDVPDADPWDQYVPTDNAGARLPYFTLTDGRSIYDALGAAFSLLAFEDVDASELEDSATSRGLPMVVIRLDLRPRHFRHRLVLVRPDHHIAWSADATSGKAKEIIDVIRGAGNADL